MKKIIYSAALIIAASTATAQVKMPAPSPTQKIVQDFGLSSIELSYSRPITKGRKIFGELVPYDKLWRTGANAATTIRFNDPVEIKGKKIDLKKYAKNMHGLSYALVVKIANDAAKKSIINSHKEISADDLNKALEENLAFNK